MVDETKIDGIPVYEIYMNLSLKDMTGEIWKDIAGFEGLYMVSSYGRVKSLGNGNAKNPMFSKERILKLQKIYDYLQVCLCKDNKRISYRVHRIVSNAFIPNPLNKPQVNHISEPLYDDKNKHLAKQDNRAVNLEWCDAKYNTNYGNAIKRRAEKFSKKVICIETGIIYPSTMEAERQTGIYQTNISKCCNGKRKTASGFHWKYIE